MKAAVNDSGRCVRLLLDCGADSELRDDCGDSALMGAAQHDSASAIAALCSHSRPADVNARSTAAASQHTALIAAASCGCLRAAQSLLRCAARLELEARDCTGATAFIAACKRGNTGVAAALLERGAEAEAADHDGDTALHWAAWQGHEPAVRFLLSLPCTRSASRCSLLLQADAAGESALCKAARSGCLGVLCLLLESGLLQADERSLDAAMRLGHDDCLHSLWAARQGSSCLASDQQCDSL